MKNCRWGSVFTFRDSGSGNRIGQLKEDRLYENTIFIVKESPEEGYEGRALGFSIFVEGDTYDEMKENIRYAIHCHFEEEHPKITRVHFTKEEVFAA